MTGEAPKSLNNVTSTFFNTVHLLAKDLKFYYGGAKLASCPGRHLTSLGPWLVIMYVGISVIFNGTYHTRKRNRIVTLSEH